MEDALSLIDETGYPVAAKPDAGVGALDTYRLDSDEDLAKFFTKNGLKGLRALGQTVYRFSVLPGPLF